MGDPDFWDGDPTGYRIDGDFDDRGGIGVRWRWSDTAAFIKCGRFWRSVGADGADGAEARFGEADGFVEWHFFFGCGGIKNMFVGEAQAFFGNFEADGDGFGEQFSCALCRLQGSVASHDGDAARVGTQVHWPQIGVAGEESDVEGVDTENFGDDSSKNIIGALADFRGATENRNTAAAVEFQLH